MSFTVERKIEICKQNNDRPGCCWYLCDNPKQSACKNCYSCYSNCPHDVYEVINDEPLPIRQENCVGCKICEEMCPTHAIYVRPLADEGRGVWSNSTMVEIKRKSQTGSRSERSWCKQGVHFLKQREFEIVLDMSETFPVSKICRILSVNRSGFYKWKHRLDNPSPKMRSFMQDVQLFIEYHERFPSHGYRWLNAKIRLDEGLVMSDYRAHRCCKFAGILSKAKHYRYKKPGVSSRVFPNLMLAGMNIDGPLQCVVSDMTAFRVNNTYHELTLYMDLWNNEILTYALSAKKGDRMTYIKGLNSLLELKKMNPDIEMVLHTDQGTVYSSKEFNEVLPMFNIIRSMSRAGTPTDNAAMESINGWIKQEMKLDFHLIGDDVEREIDEYIKFYNEERPAYSLNYLTPKQYRTVYQAV